MSRHGIQPVLRWQPTEQARRLVDAVRERGLVQDCDMQTRESK